MASIEQKSEYACSGCGACAAVCPHGAITLLQDSSGLLEAVVDGSLCVDCGACVKVCNRFPKTLSGTDLREAKLFAVQSTDAQTVKQCSSGGLAHELALDAVRHGGKAVGAVYDLTCDKVFHIIVCDEADVSMLDGSKYLQSNPQQAFTEIIREARLDKNTQFTVFGTPCQIAGLAKTCELLHIREQFLLVEIFCHGVPPYRLWEHQLERMRKKLGADRFDDVKFRFKKVDWHSYCIKAEAGGKTFYGPREREPFWHVYFENVLLGDACMTCRMRKETSLADLRIGDYWGKRYQSRSDGVSAAFACTERGKAAIDTLITNGRLSVLEPGTPEEMLCSQNMDGYHDSNIHNDSMNLLRSGGAVEDAVKCYRRREPMKRKLKRAALHAVGILPTGLRAKIRKVKR